MYLSGRGFLDGPWAGVYAFYAYLVNDLYVKVVVYADLAGKTRVVIQIGFCGKNRAFSIANLARIAGQDLYAACCAPRVAAAAVQNINSVILYGQNELSIGFGLKSNGATCGFSSNSRH